jgi:hypothetical protein
MATWWNLARREGRSTDHWFNAAIGSKNYERYLIVSNLFKKDCIRLIFWRGDRANNNSRFLEGDHKDGRQQACIRSLEEVKASKTTLQNCIRQQLRHLVNSGPGARAASPHLAPPGKSEKSLPMKTVMKALGVAVVAALATNTGHLH